MLLFYLSKVIKKHIQLLEVLCRLCGGKIRGKDKREDFAKDKNSKSNLKL